MDNLLEILNLSKGFAGVKALSNVQLDVRPGEIHALVGENGAGKSTLIKILMGVYAKDEGTIRLNGTEVDIRSPLRAKALGLAAVYQDVMLARHLSVGENFFLGALPKRGGVVHWERVYREAGEFLDGLGIHADPRQQVSRLTIARQQLIAIAKVVWQGAKLIVFDEPTALLTTSETEMLFGIIRRLQADGKAVIYVSHRMEEIFLLCQRVTVLKDGRYVGTVATAETDKDRLISMMVGREVGAAFPARRHHRGPTLLEVNGLTAAGRFRDVSFRLHAGEILGFYGLVGAGRTEVVRALFGADPYDAGEIRYDGAPIRALDPGGQIARGFALICEDRKHQSLALPLDVTANVNLIKTGDNTQVGLLRHRAERRITREFIQKLRIRTPGPHQLVRNLSGGNQQKVVLAKWLSGSPKVLFLDEPTIGVDVGARVEIYHLLQGLADAGKAMVVVSSYLPEVIGLADRILVMHEGRSMGVVEREDATEELLLRMASGLAANGAVPA